MRRILFSCLLILASTVTSPGQSVATENARAVPDFMSRSVIYQIWMRSFTPEGTLAATASHLPYIADLGATIVYLSPNPCGSFSREHVENGHTDVLLRRTRIVLKY